MRSALILLSLTFATAAVADTTHRYHVLFSGERSGTQTTTVRDNGKVSVDFTYRENGRGPDLKEEITLDAAGIPIEYRVKGQSTFGAPVEESFRRRGDRAEWRGKTDRGSITVTGPAAYLPVENSIEMVAIIARAAARQPGGKLSTLPGGEMRVEKLKELTLDGARPVPLSLYAISGVELRPTFIWLTNDESMRFAAFVFPGWAQIIDEGMEKHAAALEREQLQAEQGLQAALHRRLGHSLREPIVFRNVRVFDGVGPGLSEPQDVYVNRGRISAIYPANSKSNGAGTQIDGTGRVLMSGLYDMHTHEDAWNGVLQIAGGVTVSRDMGNSNELMIDLRRRIDSGSIIGPTIVPSGFLEGRSDFSARGGFVVNDLQGARDAVDWYAQHGYRQIKIYNSFNPAWVKDTTDYAHSRGLRVSGHIPAFSKAEDAIRNGYDEIQHVNQVLLNFYVTPQTDTRTLERFYLIANQAHGLDLDSAPVKTLIQLMKERGTVVDLTLATFEPGFTQLQGEPNPAYGMVADHMPVSQQRAWRQNSMNANKQNIVAWRASYDKVLEFSRRLFDAGVPIVAGTDEIAGFTLHRELELYVKAGIPAVEALRIATVNGALYTGTANDRGTVQPGKIADLILVDGDPTSRISDIRRISLVMQGETTYLPAEVYEAVGVKRFVDPPRIDQAGAAGGAE